VPPVTFRVAWRHVREAQAQVAGMVEAARSGRRRATI